MTLTEQTFYFQIKHDNNCPPNLILEKGLWRSPVDASWIFKTVIKYHYAYAYHQTRITAVPVALLLVYLL